MCLVPTRARSGRPVSDLGRATARRGQPRDVLGLRAAATAGQASHLGVQRTGRLSLVQHQTVNQEVAAWPKARLNWRFSTAFLEGTSGKLPVWQLKFVPDVTAKLGLP